MTIKILLPAASDQADLGLAGIVFRHGGCQSVAMESRRSAEVDTWRLKCPCGLEVSFPQVGLAATAISHTRTDGTTRPLPEGSFDSTIRDAIEVCSLQSSA